MSKQSNSITARINSKKQTLEDAYSPPANFLEIDIFDPQTNGVGKARYTDYDVRMKVPSADALLLKRNENIDDIPRTIFVFCFFIKI